MVKKTKPKKLKLIEVHWTDANVLHGWAGSESEDKLGRTAPAINVGYLLADTEKEILLCFGVGVHQQMCIMAIPQEAIKLMVHLGDSRFPEAFKEEEDD